MILTIIIVVPILLCTGGGYVVGLLMLDRRRHGRSGNASRVDLRAQGYNSNSVAKR
jgi:hypothetical protein